MKKKIRVLVVDDSALVRQVLSEVLNSDPEIEVSATASDPYIAAERIKKEVPDVITLDVEMPKMDGLTFLKKLMSQRPIPVVICSSLTDDGSETCLKALEYGAVEIITKPKMSTRQFLNESKIQICDIVKAASKAKLRKRAAKSIDIKPKLNADVMISKPISNKAMLKTTEKIIVVGASTGGTEALRVFLEMMPLDCPGIVIVQHMPETFTASFAQRLDSLCAISVKEAHNNDTVIRGRALIAPGGGAHTLLKRSGARYYVDVKAGPLVSRHRPSVDVLFRSAAIYGGKNIVSVIMTGMGDDGAKGMLELKQGGAYTIAQDEKTCVVYGMPKEAVKLNAVDKIVPLDRIAHEVIRQSNEW